MNEKTTAETTTGFSFFSNPQNFSKYKNMVKRFCHNLDLGDSSDDLLKLLVPIYAFLEKEKGHLSKKDIINQIRQDVQSEILESPETLWVRLKDWL